MTRADRAAWAEYLRAACPPGEVSALDATLLRREARAAQSREADRVGKAFEAAAYAMLDDAVRDGALARWAHYGPATRRVSATQVVVVGKAPVDIVGMTPAGHTYAAEAKHDGDRVYVLADRPRGSRAAHVQPHQREELDAVAATRDGRADLIVCVRRECAVLPWAVVRRHAWLTVTDVRACLDAMDRTSREWRWTERLRTRAAMEGLR